MKTSSLCATLLLARLLVVLGRAVPVSSWSVLAFIWQDLVVVLLFGALDKLVRQRCATWFLYVLIVLYVAINVPLQRLMFTPLTWPMARAARGPIADSIWRYVTWENCALILSVAVCGVAMPLFLARLQRARLPKHRAPTSALGGRAWAGLYVLGATLLALLGSHAVDQVQTRGLHENALAALVRSGFSHVRAEEGPSNWNVSPFGATNVEALSEWQGACSGRNLILVLLESTGANSLVAYGAAVDPTPHLTELSREAILFENAYCAYPESIKGLFSVLCSQYPAFDTQPSDYERLRVPSLAQVLSTTGYATALFHSGRFMYLGMESIIQNRGYDLLEDAGDIGGNHQSSFGVDEPATVQRMLAWIDSLAGRSFFLTYLPIAGHHPYEAPNGGPFPENDELGRYHNALHTGDAALGTFICGLKQRQLLDNTLLIFCGDHGEAFGQHDGNFGHTLFIYEENVHVPLLFVAPGLGQEPLRVQRLASLIDVTPTTLDLLGIRSPAEHQGHSLLTPQDQLVLFYADYALPWIGLRDGHWKFIYELGAGRARLFDLNVDPRESVDLSKEFPERVAIYKRHACGWAAAQKAHILGQAQWVSAP